MIVIAVVLVMVALSYSRITVHDAEDKVIRSYRFFMCFTDAHEKTLKEKNSAGGFPDEAK